MQSKLTLCLACLALLAACSKKLDQPIVKEEAVTQTSSNEFGLPPGGSNTVIKFENGKQLQGYQIDSSLYIEGDMILVPWQIEQLKKINAPASRTFLNSYVNHWYGYVPYVISSSFSTSDRNVILNAIADWQNSTTLNFVQRTTHTDYIEFRPSTINNSNIGRIGGRQIINLAVQNGVSFRSSRHEIGHAVGFFHEQSRADRDNFITVNWSNIQPTAQAQINFLRWSDQGLPGADIGTFDFNSVMLYPSFTTDTDIAINTNIPILTTINGGIWGTNIFLSAGDIQTAAFIYGPPYARVEYVNVVNESWWTWSFDHEHLEDDVYIRLYSDEQCTIPHNTPVDKQVQIKYVENINGSVWSYVGNATVTAGNHELLLQSSLVTRVYEAEWGTPTYEESRLFYGHSAFFRY